MRNARIEEFLGDDVYSFRLAYGQLLELQEKTGVGPFALYRRFMSDDWLVGDIYDTIRLGLIGGNMPPKDAFLLATKHVKGNPPMDNLNLARAILIVALHGAPDEDRAGSNKDDERAQDENEGKLKSRDYYGMGAVIGYTPQQVDEMSLHQASAAFGGYADNRNAENGRMTETEKDDLFDLVQEEQDRIDGIQ